MTSEARTEITREGSIARITLRSDGGENRIGAETLAGLLDACRVLADDGSARVVIVAGDGATFSAGWSSDLLLAAAAGDAAPIPGDPFGCLAALPLPVVAAIDGDCFSGGLELALACDIRIAGSGAHFAFPETTFGLIPLAGGTQRLPRIISRGNAIDMILLGRVVNAETALAWGLVSEVAPPGAIEGAVDRVGATIAARGPIAERFAKEAIQYGPEMPLARALRYELDLTVLLQTTEDRAEGVRAFVEKRPPRFTGR